jgi:hypothetical protein
VAQGVNRFRGDAGALQAYLFIPRSVWVPSMMQNGGTSRLVRERPRIIASRPMRVY